MSEEFDIHDDGDEEVDALLAQIEADSEDPDEREAREMKEKIESIRKKRQEDTKAKTTPKQQPKEKSQESKSRSKIPEKQCPICQKWFKPKKSKQRTCKPECGALSRIENGGRPPEYEQDDVQMKLGPLLRIGLNLKEACLECDFCYETIVRKKNEWEGFSSFLEKCSNFLVIKAKQKLFKHMSQDWGDDPQDKITTRWLLERKRPEEYVKEKKQAEAEAILPTVQPGAITNRFTQINIIVTDKPEA